MDWLQRHQVSEVECLLLNKAGNARGKFIPAQNFQSRGETRLPESFLGAGTFTATGMSKADS